MSEICLIIVGVAAAIATILASLGSTIIITKSWIFEKVRDLLQPIQPLYILVNCPMCMGFWNGLFYAILFGFGWKVVICSALITSLGGYLIELLEERLQQPEDFAN